MTGSPLATAAEAAIRRLRDVDGVRVRVEGDVLKEIHIETQSQRSAKPIVRDVQSVLRTELDLSIDHRIVSVAFVRPREGSASTLASQPALGAGSEVAARASAPAPTPVEPAPIEPSLKDERILFENVNLIVHGQRTQAQVELRWKGLPRIGNASGYGTRDESHRLVAQATTLAVQELLEDPVALDVREVGFCEVAALSRYTSGRAREVLSNGNCARTARGSNPAGPEAMTGAPGDPDAPAGCSMRRTISRSCARSRRADARARSRAGCARSRARRTPPR